MHGSLQLSWMVIRHDYTLYPTEVVTKIPVTRAILVVSTEVAVLQYLHNKP